MMAQETNEDGRASRVSVDKPKVEVEMIENALIHRGPRYYSASTPREKALDTSINFKCDILIVTLLAINFLLCGIDKTNIGNAATTTFIKDAHLGPNDVSNAVSWLSLTFVTLQPISTVLGRRIGPKYWIPIIMICWGSICMGHAGVKGSGSLIALRLLLGAAEAGFVPTTFYYLSTVYPNYFLGLRLGLFAGMYSIAGAFAGLIAYGIFHIKSSHLKDWQILFLLEGGLTIFMAIVTFFILPRRLETAWFLNEEERQHAIHRLKVDVAEIFESETEDHALIEGRGISKRDIIDAITDWPKLLTVVFNILATLPVSAFGTFLPLIVKGMGYSGIESNLMSVPPFVVGAFGLFAFAFSSDHFQERSIHTICSMSLALVGLIVMSVSHDAKLRYGFTHIAMAGAFTAGPIVVAWLARNVPLKGPRSVMIGINGYSNIAGVIAGQLFKAKYAPSYQYPLHVTMILVAVGMVGFFAIRILYMYINRSRAKKMARCSDSDLDEENRSNIRRGHQKFTFQYGY